MSHHKSCAQTIPIPSLCYELAKKMDLKKCESCGIYVKLVKYDRHRLVHSLETPFTCDQCPQRFKSKEYLKRHHKQKHSKVLIKCPNCPLIFYNPTLLTRHKKEAKVKAKYKCIYCCNSYNLERFINNHIKLNHPNENDVDKGYIIQGHSPGLNGDAGAVVFDGKKELVQEIDIYPENSSSSNMFENFVLKVWTCDSYDREHGSEFLEIVSYLSGQMQVTCNRGLCDFLSKKPEHFVGQFPIAVLVADYAINSDVEVAVDLLNNKDSVLKTYHGLITGVLLYIVQRGIRICSGNFTNIFNLPTQVTDNLSYDFLKPPVIRDSRVFTMAELKIAGNIRQGLLEFSMPINYKENPLQLIMHNTTIIDTIIKKQAQEKQNQMPIFTILSLQMLEEKVSTVVYFNHEVGNEVFPVHLHQEMVSQYGDGRPNHELICVASFQDISTLQQLLYKPYENIDLKNKINLAVYNLALVLRIRDIWWFLFRNEHLQEIMDHQDKEILLRIAIMEKRDQVIDELIDHLHMISRVHDLDMVLVGLTIEDAKYFLDRHSSLTQLQGYRSYRMIVMRAIAASGSTGIGYQDLIHFSKHKFLAAKPWVQELRSYVKLDDLKEHYHEILTHGFFN